MWRLLLVLVPVARLAPASAAPAAASSLVEPASVEVAAGTGASAKAGSKPGSKAGSRRASLKGAVLPGMIAEPNPYVVKALYSHVGTIPEQLSFKRTELLIIDGAMEGWLSASVMAEPETDDTQIGAYALTSRRGWAPANFVQRVAEADLPAAIAAVKTKPKSRRTSTTDGVNVAASTALEQPCRDCTNTGQCTILAPVDRSES